MRCPGCVNISCKSSYFRKVNLPASESFSTCSKRCRYSFLVIILWNLKCSLNPRLYENRVGQYKKYVYMKYIFLYFNPTKRKRFGNVYVVILFQYIFIDLTLPCKPQINYSQQGNQCLCILFSLRIHFWMLKYKHIFSGTVW